MQQLRAQYQFLIFWKRQSTRRLAGWPTRGKGTRLFLKLDEKRHVIAGLHTRPISA